MAELGEITTEWSVIRHWPAGAKPGELLTEEEARGFVRRHPGGGIRVALGRRFVGEWREVEES